MLKGRALRGVEGSAQRAAVLAGRSGGEYGQQRWGSGPQGHVKAAPRPLTSESLYRPTDGERSRYSPYTSPQRGVRVERNGVENFKITDEHE